jgi:hypothetical protein
MPKQTDYIVIPNWPKFQHYKDRLPPWIKLYLELLHKPEWRRLSLRDRGLLTGIWLAYAEANGRLQVRDVFWMFDSEGCSAGVARVLRSRCLRRLNHAGFIAFSASTPLSLSLKPLGSRARGNKRNGRPACPFCETGGGLHTADCPTLEDASLLVEHLVAGVLV